MPLGTPQAGIKEVVYHEAKGEARRSDSPITGGNFKCLFFERFFCWAACVASAFNCQQRAHQFPQRS